MPPECCLRVLTGCPQTNGVCGQLRWPNRSDTDSRLADKVSTAVAVQLADEAVAYFDTAVSAGKPSKLLDTWQTYRHLQMGNDTNCRCPNEGWCGWCVRGVRGCMGGDEAD